MSTSNTYQQSLADVGSETKPLMLERGSYIPWASRFRRYLNRKRENRNWLNKAIDEGPYEFKDYIPLNSQTPTIQIEEVLTGDDLKHYEAEIEAMNLILISIPNEIYNSVDACTTAKAIHLPQSCLRLTLEGFPFVTVNTKEYHSECSGKISRIMRRTLCYQMLFKGTDKTNITRKPSKTGKHEHGNQKSTKEAKDSKQKPRIQS
ncbi:hypothetical protein Tco_1431713 [Tanacetum coccineum]